MKRWFVIFLCFIFTLNASFSFSLFKKNKKEDDTEPKSGYNGVLPNIDNEFDAVRKKTAEPSKPIFNYNTDLDKETLSRIPLDNSKYIEIIMKKDDPSEFVLDIRDIITVLEKINKTIKNKSDIQFFNAQVAVLIGNVNYFQEKYYNKKGYDFSGYGKIVQVCEDARNLAVISTRKRLYNQYITSEEQQYSPEYINYKMGELSENIDKALIFLKNEEKK